MGEMYEEVGKRLLSLIRKDREFYAVLRKETDYYEVAKNDPNYQKFMDKAEILTMIEALEQVQSELDEELENEE